MADITLSWPRLTCPALARRQPAPAPWKMSATSSLGRLTAAGLTLGSRFLLEWRCEPVERADHGADRGVSDAGVKSGGVELGVAEQHLDDADVGVLLQQMRGEAVPQGVRRHPLLDPGSLSGGMNGAVKLTGRQRLDRVTVRKQPTSRQQCTEPSALAPP